MRKNIFLAAIGLLAYGAVQASGNNNDNETPGKKVNEINGSVLVSSSKKPIENVSVTAYMTSKKEKVVITDTNGNYAFDDLKPGVYKFVFEKEGYKKVTKENVAIKTDEAFLLNIEMITSEGTQLFPSPFHFMDN
ncbi:MAG: hypothetical protein GC171_05540 [Terrimonas sp.]|nr:hypothetical protein [Terrimonas sp.]